MTKHKNCLTLLAAKFSTTDSWAQCERHCFIVFSIPSYAHLSSHAELHLLSSDSCGWGDISHIFLAVLNMHVGGSCQVPGSLFSLFSHSSDYGLRQTCLCGGYLINKTWGTQIKGILISSSGPLPFLRLKLNWGSSVAERCGWGCAGDRVQWLEDDEEESLWCKSVMAE